MFSLWFFLDSMGAVSDGHGESFHKDVAKMEQRQEQKEWKKC